jgi:hypothetical protein
MPFRDNNKLVNLAKSSFIELGYTIVEIFETVVSQFVACELHS